MNVRTISITQPLIEGINSAEELIVHNARVSNPNNQLNTETGGKLISYCIKQKHWSIFEQCDLTLEVTTSRAIAAQLIRHKSFNFSEKSQRYCGVSEVEPLEWRMQGKTNRQVGDEEKPLPSDLQEEVERAQHYCWEAYNSLIEEGYAKECARFLLPLNTQTVLYVKGSVRSWIHYFEVRCTEHCQKEHRDLAFAIRKEFVKYFPVISKELGYLE